MSGSVLGVSSLRLSFFLVAPFSGSVAFGIEQNGFKPLGVGVSVEVRIDDAGSCSYRTFQTDAHGGLFKIGSLLGSC